jgi:hypothetical protein
MRGDSAHPPPFRSACFVRSPFFINAITSSDRHTVIASIERAISGAGGWVIDHHAFSNRSLSITVEIGAARLPGLIAAVMACDVVMMKESEEALDIMLGELSAPGSDLEQTLRGYVQIAFHHDLPDLRHEVPCVPG